MKGIKKYLGGLLAVMFAFSLMLTLSVRAEATDTKYTVTISLGNLGESKEASFNVSKIEAMGYAASSIQGNKLVITENYNSSSPKTLSRNAICEAIDIKADSNGVKKHYVKGLRVAGADAIISSDIVFDKDETYVVAYGVGEVISYIVKFVDEKGNAVASPITLYAGKGESIKVPAEHITGYTPDVESKDIILNTDKQEVVFTYKAPTEKENVTYKEITSIQYINGTPTYTYDYEYVEGEPQVRTNTNTGNTVVNNREIAAAGTEAGAAGAAEGAEAAEAGAEGEGDAAGESAEGSDETTITDPDTPLGIEIPETDTPLGGQNQRSGLSRVLVTIAVITIILIIAVIITTYYVSRKRNR